MSYVAQFAISLGVKLDVLTVKHGQQSMSLVRQPRFSLMFSRNVCVLIHDVYVGQQPVDREVFSSLNLDYANSSAFARHWVRDLSSELNVCIRLVLAETQRLRCGSDNYNTSRATGGQ